MVVSQQVKALVGYQAGTSGHTMDPPPQICTRGDVESHSEHSDSDTESPEDMPGGAPE